jgi:antitoxin VapB
MQRTAKLFQNGRSQAVRLPAEFRFEGTEVFIRATRRPGTWCDFFDLMKDVDIPEDFLRDRGDRPPQKRKPL